MEFSCRAVTARVRGNLSALAVMAWFEALVVAGLGLLLVGGPGRWWFLLTLIVPVAVTNALPCQVAGSTVLLNDQVLTVRWLRSPRFRYSFQTTHIASAEVVPHPDPPRTRDSFDPSTGLLELVRGASPLVHITFKTPQPVTYAGGGLRLWGNPRPAVVSVSQVLLAVDEPARLVEALRRKPSGPGVGHPPTAIPPIARASADAEPGATAAPATDRLVGHELSLSYGAIRAADRVSLEVRPGEVVGLVGLNGAGKSTTLRMLAGVARPDRGRVTVFGADPGGESAASLAARARLGLMPDSFPVYARMTGWDYLDFVSLLHGIAIRDARSRLVPMAAELGLDQTVLARPSAGYSAGMKRKLLLLAAALHQPTFLLLDEPTSGLDPDAQRRFRSWLERLRAGGVGVLLSSHSLDLVADCCTTVVVMHQGRVLARGSLGELAARYDLPPTRPDEIFFAAIDRATGE